MESAPRWRDGVNVRPRVGSLGAFITGSATGDGGAPRRRTVAGCVASSLRPLTSHSLETIGSAAAGGGAGVRMRGLSSRPGGQDSNQGSMQLSAVGTGPPGPHAASNSSQAAIPSSATTAPTSPTSSPLSSTFPPSLPLARIRGLRADDIRHPLDRQNTALLRAIPGLNDLGRALLGPVQEQILVLENLGSGVLVSPQQLPSLHALMHEAAALLDMPSAPDLYVRQSAVPNAYTLAISGRKPFVVVHTALLDLLTPCEVQAVLAHELGHLKCEHGLWLTFANLLAMGAASSLPGVLGAMLARGLEDQLLRWLRAAELTCDRAALVVVRDPRVVVSVLMKLAGGSTGGGGGGSWGVRRRIDGVGGRSGVGKEWEWDSQTGRGGGVSSAASAGASAAAASSGPGWWSEELSVDAFLAQARSYDEAASSGPLAWYLRNAQTSQLSHPLPVLRAREVDRWARGGEFKQLMGRSQAAARAAAARASLGAMKGGGGGGGSGGGRGGSAAVESGLTGGGAREGGIGSQGVSSG